MPTAILKFKLPEEEDAFAETQMAQKYAAALEGFYQWIRNKSKYGGGDDTRTGPAAFHDCFDEFLRICQEHGFDPLTGRP